MWKYVLFSTSLLSILYFTTLSFKGIDLDANVSTKHIPSDENGDQQWKDTEVCFQVVRTKQRTSNSFGYQKQSGRERPALQSNPEISM